MRKIKEVVQFISNLKLRTKLLLSYLLIVLLTILPTGFYFIQKNTRTALEYTDEITENSFKQLLSNVENEWKKNLLNAVNLSNESMMKSYLASDANKNKDESEKYLAYQRILISIKPKLDLLEIGGDSVVFFTNNPYLFAGPYIQGINKKQEIPHYEDIVKNKGEMTISEPVIVGGEYKVPFLGILPQINQSIISIIRMDIPESKMFNLIEKEGENKQIFILNQYNKIITSTERKLIGTSAENLPFIHRKLLEANYVFVENNKKEDGTKIYSSKVNITGIAGNIRVISIISTNKMLADIKDNIKFSILVIFGVVIVASILIVIISNTLTKRIEKLAQNMSGIRDGNFEVYVDSENKDEIGELTRSFRNMISRINQLIEQVYVADSKIKELNIQNKEAKLMALYSQINPHFLFNTLESIRMNLLRRGEREVAGIVRDFAMLVRKSLNWSDNSITLRNEIELLECYLNIQKFRFKDKLSYEIQAEEELLKGMVPKFTLQPIVENAIIHGLEEKKESGHVRVVVERAEEKIRISVEDDGVGMDEESLKRLQVEISYQGSSKKGEGHQSVGLNNVNQRLILNYGEEYRMAVESRKDEGTRVTVYLPLDTAYMEGSNV